MAEMIKTVEHLASEIGPRPVATEEEQQAALYIAHELEQAGLPTEIEEFQGSVSHKKTRLVCSAVAVVLAIISLFLPVIALPAVLACFACAALFFAEELGKPILSKILDKGISQNVVARYVPASAKEGKGRRRKVVLVARVDSGSVRPELNPPLLSAMPVLAKVSRIGMLALPVFLLIKSLFFLHSTGIAFVVSTVLLIVICLCAALPAISFAMEKVSGLSDGANAAASGVAVMLEVARRVSGSGFQSVPDAESPVVHGSDAAYEAGVVPDGAQLVYEAQENVPVGEYANDSLDTYTEEGAAAVSGISLREPKQREEEVRGANVSCETMRENVVTISDSEVHKDGFSKNSIASAGAASVTAAGAITGVAVGVAAGAAAASAATSAASAAPAQTAAVMEAASDASAASMQVAASVASIVQPQANEVPSWFSTGRAAARRNEAPSTTPRENIKRSTFATALEAAERRLSEVSAEENPFVGMASAIPEQNFAPMDEPSAPQVRQADVIPSSAEQPEVAETEPTSLDAEVLPASQTSANADDAVPVPVGIAQPAAVLQGPLAREVSASPTSAASAADDGVPTVVPEILPPVNDNASAGDDAVAYPSVAVSETVVAFEGEMPSKTIVEAAERVTVEASAEVSPAQPAPISMDYFMAAAVGANAGDTVVAQPVVPTQERHALTLPDLSATGSIPVIDIQKQRAPLAQAEESSETAAKSLLTMLPSIEAATPSQADLRASLPSLSGIMAPVAATQVFEPVAGATGSFAPVTEALALDAGNEEELFVDDADDSSFEENHTETGAYAGPEYIDMPKKRGFGIFDKLFGHKKKEEDAPAPTWDNDYDFNETAEDSWGSYDSYEPDSEESQGFYDDDDYEDDYAGYNDDALSAFDQSQNSAQNNDEYEGDFDFEYDDNDFSTFFDDKEDTAWKGGAFSGKLSSLADGASGVASRVRQALPGGKEDGSGKDAARGRNGHRNPERTMRSGQAAEVEYDAYESDNGDYEDAYAAERAARRSENEEYERVYQMIADRYGLDREESASEDASAGAWDEAQREIEDFRAGDIDTEVWFVALGAESDCHAGMEEFIAAHRQELRGAIVVELDSLGAGVLSTTTKEGVLKPQAASSRMRRYAKHASQASGVPVETTSILWGESAASIALRRGLQSMHVVGMDGVKPALYAQVDDTAENVDPEILADNANFVVELIKGI